METKNVTERHQVGKEEVELGMHGVSASGGSADVRRDCTVSTQVGSIPSPDNVNKINVQTPTPVMSNCDSIRNNSASSLISASQNTLIVDSSDLNKQQTASVPPSASIILSVDDEQAPADPNDVKFTLDNSRELVNDEISPSKDGILNCPPQSSPEVDTVAERTSFPSVEANAPKQGTTEVSSNLSVSTPLDSHIKEQFLNLKKQNVDETVILESAVRVLRAPLVDTYSPYIEPFDVSLEAARTRLRKAIDQTRQLRAAFSDRVYDKYRVCLRPPPSTSDILKGIYADPIATSVRLQEETRKLSEEKETEKKEANELNAQWAASNSVNGTSAIASAESAEQFMYISAGLSLVILPEQEVDDIDMSRFHDRAPIDSETGQRIRSISIAAATAGELIIDRARKGSVLIQERKRRQELQSLSSHDPEVLNRSTQSRLPISTGVGNEKVARAAPLEVSIKPPAKAVSTKVVPVIIPQPGATASTATTPLAKGHRTRAPPAMSANNLLSLSPTSEELRPSAKISAATAALISKGVGCSSLLKSPQQRWKHPHPDSLGGKRQSQSLKNYAAFLSISLPPVPTSKERRDAKPMTVVESKDAGSPRAMNALEQVVSQFVGSHNGSQNSTSHAENQHRKEVGPGTSDGQQLRLVRKRRITEIGLLQGIQRIVEHHHQSPANAANELAKNAQLPQRPDDRGQTETSIDPIVALCVLQAIGLVRKPNGNFDISTRLDSSRFVSGGNPPFLHKLVTTSKAISSRKRNFSDAFLSTQALDRNFIGEQSLVEFDCYPVSPPVSTELEVEKAADSGLVLGCTTSPSAKSVESCPVESLRGGGDVLLNSPCDDSAKDEMQDALNDKSSGDRQIPTSEVVDDSRNSEPSIVVADGSTLSSTPVPLDAITMQMPSPSSPMASYAGQTVVWEEHAPQAISLLNSRLPLSDEIYASVAANSAVISQQRNGVFLGSQPNGEHYHHRPAASAIQLAHQLRHATVSIAGLAPQGHQPGAADLSEYIGSLHSTQARAYDWSSYGAAAMAASLGLAPHHTALTVPDQARLLLSREQQTAVAQAQAVAAHRQAAAVRGTPSAIPPHLLFNGVPTHSFSAPPASRFAHLGAQSAASAAAFLTSSASSRLLGRVDIPTQPLANNTGPADRPSEPQPSQNVASSRSLKGPGQSEGFEAVEAKSREELVSKDIKKQNEHTDTHSLRKRKNFESTDGLASSVDQPFESLDASKRRKNTGSRINSDDNLRSESSETVHASNSEGTTTKAPIDSGFEPQAEGVKPYATEADVTPARSEETHQSSYQAPSGSIEGNAMRFVLPPVPPSLPCGLADLVRCGRVHEAIESLTESEDLLVPVRIALIEYLVTLGANVPIPKALVSNPLKDRLSTIFKNSAANGNHSILREVMVATILVWLWTQHEDSFQRAFGKNGRIDVDPNCKWLIQASIDASTQALTNEIADAEARGGAMASAFAGQAKASVTDDQLVTPASASLNVLVASTVSRSLMTELELDDTMDFSTDAFQRLVEYLDDCRQCALRCKSRERALLATIASRRSTMSEAFSHAYVSAMVRAGMAIGHFDLFESVQHETTMTHTMMPYDIIEDENGLWEDPCRPSGDVSQPLSGDDLMKRAHARAMIQKSLKKLQDRHHLKGGVPRPGPYADPVSTDVPTPQGGGSKWGSGGGQASQYQRGWYKRRTSSFSEPPVPPGTGSAEATSKSLYDPRHYSAPLLWLVDEIENTPYGRHNFGARSLSIAPMQNFFRGVDAKRPPKEKSLPAALSAPIEGEPNPARSTCEIDWADVAGIFQQVTLPGSSPGKREADEASKAPDRDPKSIIAPFCRKIKIDELPGPDEEEESSEDENLNDDEILSRHQVVLDRMKQRLNTFFETRKKAQQRRKTNKIRT